VDSSAASVASWLLKAPHPPAAGQLELVCRGPHTACCSLCPASSRPHMLAMRGGRVAIQWQPPTHWPAAPGWGIIFAGAFWGTGWTREPLGAVCGMAAPRHLGTCVVHASTPSLEVGAASSLYRTYWARRSMELSPCAPAQPMKASQKYNSAQLSSSTHLAVVAAWGWSQQPHLSDAAGQPDN
jgi:hypothetical protein